MAQQVERPSYEQLYNDCNFLQLAVAVYNGIYVTYMATAKTYESIVSHSLKGIGNYPPSCLPLNPLRPQLGCSTLSVVMPSVGLILVEDLSLKLLGLHADGICFLAQILSLN